MTLSLTPFYVVSPKEKEKERNINNDLAILPSHDRKCLLHFPLTIHLAWGLSAPHRPCSIYLMTFA